MPCCENTLGIVLWDEDNALDKSRPAHSANAQSVLTFCLVHILPRLGPTQHVIYLLALHFSPLSHRLLDVLHVWARLKAGAARLSQCFLPPIELRLRAEVQCDIPDKNTSILA